ncbi:hypothetical protein F5890DRAFT_1421983, partial [Lentinula detonsa]
MILTVKTFTNEKGDVKLTFEDALHVPDVSYNLVSISRMDALGYQILFGKGVAKFFSPTGTHFLTGHGSGGLYRLDEKP